MKGALLRWVLSGPLTVVALLNWAVAQDGPLLPGLAPGAAEDASGQLNEPHPELTVPADGGRRPFDADASRSILPFPDVLNLPDPPPLERKVDQARPKNLRQKSTEAVRNLTKPNVRPENVEAEDNQASDAIRNWQMLRRPPTTPSLPRVPWQRTSPAPRRQSNLGVEASKPRGQQPSSRRQAQSMPPQRNAPTKSRVKTAPQTPDPRDTVDNTPRHPWERATPLRRRAAPPVRAVPSQGISAKSPPLRSAQGTPLKSK